jgi:hypothetical protein
VGRYVTVINAHARKLIRQTDDAVSNTRANGTMYVRSIPRTVPNSNKGE